MNNLSPEMTEAIQIRTSISHRLCVCKDNFTFFTVLLNDPVMCLPKKIKTKSVVKKKHDKIVS